MSRATIGFSILGYVGLRTLFHPKKVYKEIQNRGGEPREIIVTYGMSLFVLLAIILVLCMITDVILGGPWFMMNVMTISLIVLSIEGLLLILAIIFLYAIRDKSNNRPS